MALNLSNSSNLEYLALKRLIIYIAVSVMPHSEQELSGG